MILQVFFLILGVHVIFIVQLFPAHDVWVLSIMKQQSNIKDNTVSGSESSVNTDLKL